MTLQWGFIVPAFFEIIILSLALFILSKKLRWKARWKAWIPGIRMYIWGESLKLYRDGMVCGVLDVIYILALVIRAIAPKEDFGTILALLQFILFVFVFIYKIRLFLELLKLFERGRKWVLLYLIGDWFPLLILGLSKNYQPKHENIKEENWQAGSKPLPKDDELCNAVPLVNEGLSIQIRERTVRDFGKKRYLLDDIALNIPEKSLVLLLGGSGAGKTTLITLVVGKNMFLTMEGTTYGTFALSCACIWNGVFNSIQVVCRERDIVKREHRSGLYISSYVTAHMLYQLLLCFLQTLVTLLICAIVGVHFPETGVITSSGIVDLGITLLIITYAADMLGLMVSSLVRSTTTAMTVVPFLLIFQLIFSGNFFGGSLGRADFVKNLTISHWGMDGMCIIGQYNSLPMTTLWKTMVKFQNITVGDTQPIQQVVQYMRENNMVANFKAWSGAQSGNPAYESIPSNVWHCWGALLAMIAIFAIVSMVALQLIDRDKR